MDPSAAAHINWGKLKTGREACSSSIRKNPAMSWGSGLGGRGGVLVRGDEELEFAEGLDGNIGGEYGSDGSDGNDGGDGGGGNGEEDRIG